RRGRERGEERVGLRAEEAADPLEERFREPALPALLSTGRAVPPTAPASPRDESAEPLTFAPSPARSAARALRRAAPRPGSNHRSGRKVSPHASTGTGGPNRAAPGPRGPPCSTAPWTVPRARHEACRPVADAATPIAAAPSTSAGIPPDGRSPNAAAAMAG